MKRTLSIVILFLLLASGCQSRQNNMASFYYLCKEPVFGSAQGVLECEQRDISGCAGDLSRILSMYLQGPEDDSLTMPIPQGTRILEYGSENGILTVTFSSHLALLEGMELTKACACIASTCFQLTDAQQIQIRTQDTPDGPGVSISMSRNSILTFDEIRDTIPTDG